jgi:hypothetical protein
VAAGAVALGPRLEPRSFARQREFGRSACKFGGRRGPRYEVARPKNPTTGATLVGYLHHAHGTGTQEGKSTPVESTLAQSNCAANALTGSLVVMGEYRPSDTSHARLPSCARSRCHARSCRCRRQSEVRAVPAIRRHLPRDNPGVVLAAATACAHRRCATRGYCRTRTPTRPAAARAGQQQQQQQRKRTAAPAGAARRTQ